MTLRTPPSPPIRGVDTLTEEETRTAPPKRWRNRYRVILEHENARLGILRPGELVWGRSIYPSKEIAEQCALESERILARLRLRASLALGDVDYLGAFPVEEGA